MKPVFSTLGTDWEKHYGQEAAKKEVWEVPVPASFLVDTKGMVRERYVEANYHERLEPETAVDWIKKLKSAN
jgi:peroxiredoxin